MNKARICFNWGVVLLLVAVPLLYWLITSSADKQTLTVAGNSMSPTIKAGAQVKIQKLSYETLRQGDLVAIQFKTRKRPMLKRIIALEGDQVEFVNNRLKLNGAWLNTSWWSATKRLAPRNYKILAIQLSRYGNRIPKNNLIVMGDNSNNSLDSGDYGMISRDQLVGKIIKQ